MKNTSLDSLKTFGKSFYWAGKILPKHYLNRSADLYSFCRILDDIADQGKSTLILKKLNLIKNFIKQENYKKLNQIKINVPNFLKNDEVSKKAMIDLLDGLIFDQGTVRVKTLDELIKYCYKVAGTVGILMCFSLDCKDNEAKKFAIDLGIAMQLTNIIRDVLEDAKMDRRYLPSSMTKNILPIEILSINENQDHISQKIILQRALGKIFNISENYYCSGRSGLYFLPFKIRIGIAVASNVYREIGVISKNNYFSWYKRRYYTSKFQKIKITLKTVAQEILFHKRKMPTHKKNLHLPIREFLK